MEIGFVKGKVQFALSFLLDRNVNSSWKAKIHLFHQTPRPIHIRCGNYIYYLFICCKLHHIIFIYLYILYMHFVISLSLFFLFYFYFSKNLISRTYRNEKRSISLLSSRYSSSHIILHISFLRTAKI